MSCNRMQSSFVSSQPLYTPKPRTLPKTRSTIRANASSEKLNKYSSRITEPKSQGASQAVLYGVGLSDADMKKPQVGISSVWYEGNTCNMHLLQLAEAVKAGVLDAGMIGFRFNTIGVSDAISMGTRGMCYSLQSRDLIADSIETVMAAQWYDANISIPGCDKNMPGTIMAMGRLNRPSLMIYGGTIKPGHFEGHTYDIVSAFQVYGEYVSGSVSEDQRQNVVRNSCPGAGACGGMYTANTMASAIEAMGMTLPYSSSTPAEDPLKLDECRLAGKYILDLIKMDLKPRDIITHKSLRNAMVIVMALGGSTNAVLHLIAIARSVGLQLTLDDFQKVSDQVPFLADLKPSGKYVMEDVHKIGGTPAIIRYLLELGYLDGDCITVTGKTLAENAKLFPPLSEGQGATIVDQLVEIALAPDYKLPEAATATHTSLQATENQNAAAGTGSAVQKAEDVVSSMLARGFTLGKDVVNKAKTFDDKHQFTSTATGKVAALDQKIGISEKIGMGTSLVNEKMKEVDDKFQVSEKTKAAFAAAEQTVSSAGSTVMKNRYVLTGASWVTGAFNKVTKAAGDVGQKTKEKMAEEEKGRNLTDGYAQVHESHE